MLLPVLNDVQLRPHFRSESNRLLRGRMRLRKVMGCGVVRQVWREQRSAAKARHACPLTFSILFVMLAVSFLFNLEAYDPTPFTALEIQTQTKAAYAAIHKMGFKGGRGGCTRLARRVRAAHAVVAADCFSNRPEWESERCRGREIASAGRLRGRNAIIGGGSGRRMHRNEAVAAQRKSTHFAALVPGRDGNLVCMP
jgi:hypothetical protein